MMGTEKQTTNIPEHKLLSVSIEDVCLRPYAYAVKPFYIMDNLYYIGNSWVGVYLVDTHHGLLLIDTAMAQNVYLTMENIRILGFDPHDIKWILLSHGHYDHCGGAADISNFSGAKIFLGKEDLFFFQGRDDLIAYPFGYFQPFKVSDTYIDGALMKFGDFEITAVHTPGHTPGCYSFFFNLRENGKNYRAAMHGGLGVNTLTPKYLKEHNLPFSLQQDYLNNLERMRKEKVDVPLGSHTNHGDMLGKASRIGQAVNPFIDPDGFSRVIDSRLADFEYFCK